MALVPLEKVISTALLVPMGNPSSPDCIWGLPLLLWGSPGIGKTARIRSAGKSAFLSVKSVIASTRAPEDFSGVPVPLMNVEEGQSRVAIECILPAIRELCVTGRGVLFLDEISCVVPAVQASMLSLVHDRVVGDLALPPAVRIIAAANPPSEAAGGWELEPPMANRFAHLIVPDPSAREWTNWLLGNVEDDVPEIEVMEERVIQNWAESWGRVRSHLAGFFSAFPDGLLFKLPSAVDKNRGKAWPSPRTWEMAGRAVATCYALGSPGMAHTFVAACVGEAAAVVWSEWLSKADLPHPHDVVTKGWDPDPRRIDRNVAVFSSITEYVIAQTNPQLKEEYAIGAWKVFEKAKNKGLLDTIVQFAQKFRKEGLTADKTRSSPAVAAAARSTILELGVSGIAEISSKA